MSKPKTTEKLQDRVKEEWQALGATELSPKDRQDARERIQNDLNNLRGKEKLKDIRKERMLLDRLITQVTDESRKASDTARITLDKERAELTALQNELLARERKHSEFGDRVLLEAGQGTQTIKNADRLVQAGVVGLGVAAVAALWNKIRGKAKQGGSAIMKGIVAALGFFGLTWFIDKYVGKGGGGTGGGKGSGEGSGKRPEGGPGGQETKPKQGSPAPKDENKNVDGGAGSPSKPEQSGINKYGFESVSLPNHKEQSRDAQTLFIRMLGIETNPPLQQAKNPNDPPKNFLLNINGKDEIMTGSDAARLIVEASQKKGWPYKYVYVSGVGPSVLSIHALGWTMFEHRILEGTRRQMGVFMDDGINIYSSNIGDKEFEEIIGMNKGRAQQRNRFPGGTVAPNVDSFGGVRGGGEAHDKLEWKPGRRYRCVLLGPGTTPAAPYHLGDHRWYAWSDDEHKEIISEERLRKYLSDLNQSARLQRGYLDAEFILLPQSSGSGNPSYQEQLRTSIKMSAPGTSQLKLQRVDAMPFTSDDWKIKP